MIRSLRVRLLLGATVTFVLILATLGVALDASIRRTLIGQFDTALLAKAQALSSMVEQHHGRVNFEFDPHDMPEFDTARRSAFFELWVNGRFFARSPSLRDGVLVSAPEMAAHASFTPITLPDGSRGRAVVFPFRVHVDNDEEPNVLGEPCDLIVVRHTRELDEALLTIRCVIAGFSAAAVLISAAALFWVVTRSLQPVNHLAAEIAKVQESTLSVRFDEQGLPAEIAPLVTRLNQLLQRLERAFERERGFTADVAHELRTPVAGLRALLEVSRSRPRDPAAYSATIDRALGVIHSMQTTIENLLLLARAESGELASQATEFDLAECMRQQWLQFEQRATELSVQEEWELPQRFIIRSDRAKLQIVLVNLFDNAVSYVEPGGTIQFRLVQTQTDIALSVKNTGSELRQEDAPRVFERFWRKDPSRSETGIHAGLGLSLCQRLITVLGGTIQAELEGDLFCVTCRLPGSGASDLAIDSLGTAVVGVDSLDRPSR